MEGGGGVQRVVRVSLTPATVPFCPFFLQKKCDLFLKQKIAFWTKQKHDFRGLKDLGLFDALSDVVGGDGGGGIQRVVWVERIPPHGRHLFS
jgi:hypothetical protein